MYAKRQTEGEPTRGTAERRLALTGARKLIYERAIELHVRLADLSRACGTNDAYVHQFLYKGSPKYLPEHARNTIAAMLDLDDNVLRDRPPAPNRVVRIPASKSPRASAAQGEVTPVPLFLENQAVNLTRPASSIPAMPSKLGRADFALWIRIPHGRIQSGDVAFVQREYPTRPGDHVVVLAGDKVQLIGELTAMTAATVTIADGGMPQDFPRDAVSVLKIIGVAFP
jgi:hypothetical protein